MRTAHEVDCEILGACRDFIASHGRTRLATRTAADGRSEVTIAEGYVPLLVDYTQEDREAKGLRKLSARETAPLPVPYTVLEVAASEPLLFLTGPSGCGKSTSLLHLGLELAGARTGDPRWVPDVQGRPVMRNAADKSVAERWSGPNAVPLLVCAEKPATLHELLSGAGPIGHRIRDGSFERDAVLMIDGAERLGETGPALLEEAAILSISRPGLRVIIAADADAGRAWPVPPSWARRRIVGLIESQRRALRAAVRPDAEPWDWASTSPEVRDHAGFFTLALESGLPIAETQTDAIDRWLRQASRRSATPVDALVDLGADAHDGIDMPSGSTLAIDGGDLRLLQRPFIQRQLAALRLSSAPPAVISARHAADPLKWAAPVEIAAGRVAQRGGRELESFVSALIAERAEPGVPQAGEQARERAVVTAAAILGRLPAGRVGSAVHAAVRAGLARIVEHGRLPTSLRRDAGRALAREGDPRDLEALVPIPGGPFTMGSTAHLNSAPAHTVVLQPYRIGRYPVVNRLYRQFVEATGHPWRSRDGLLAERENAPAVDLTWHDARACCEWLTVRWRAEGKIDADQMVRLPTEAEWERAARGIREAESLIYPWPGDWQADRANSEEAGFNDTCAVGLFPLGRSPDGCDDMAGQVWEWTSTLWGTDMATPHFRYPYATDGREDSAAPANLRRVLRGACFLSPREKANCVYRGSLEPDGFWRGNGLRVAVAPVSAPRQLDT